MIQKIFRLLSLTIVIIAMGLSLPLFAAMQRKNPNKQAQNKQAMRKAARAQRRAAAGLPRKLQRLENRISKARNGVVDKSDIDLFVALKIQSEQAAKLVDRISKQLSKQGLLSAVNQAERDVRSSVQAEVARRMKAPRSSSQAKAARGAQKAAQKVPVSVDAPAPVVLPEPLEAAVVEQQIVEERSMSPEDETPVAIVGVESDTTATTDPMSTEEVTE